MRIQHWSYYHQLLFRSGGDTNQPARLTLPACLPPCPVGLDDECCAASFRRAAPPLSKSGRLSRPEDVLRKLHKPITSLGMSRCRTGYHQLSYYNESNKLLAELPCHAFEK